MRSTLRDVEGAAPYNKLQSHNVGTDAYCAVSLCHFVTSPSHREEVFPGGPPQADYIVSFIVYYDSQHLIRQASPATFPSRGRLKAAKADRRGDSRIALSDITFCFANGKPYGIILLKEGDLMVLSVADGLLQLWYRLLERSLTEKNNHCNCISCYNILLLASTRACSLERKGQVGPKRCFYCLGSHRHRPCGLHNIGNLYFFHIALKNIFLSQKTIAI